MSSQPDPLEEPIFSLERVLADLRIEEERIRKTLLAHQDRVRRVTRALDILTERERKTAKAPKSSSNHWAPKPENVEKVYAAVQAGATTPPEMEQTAGLSRSTVHKALDVLRSEERVRKTGTTQAGKSNQKVSTFALMPQAVEDAA